MRLSRRKKILAGGLALFALLVGIFILVLPEIVRRVALSRIERVVTVPVSIADIDLNVFTGKAVVSKLVIGAKSPHPIMRLPRLTLHFSPLSVLFGPTVIDNMHLIRPQIYLQRTAPARFNFTGLLRSQEESSGSAIFPLTLKTATIDDGQVTFLDKTVEPVFDRTLQDITLHLGRISTLPKFVVTPTSFELRFSLGQGRIAISGEAAPLTRPSTVRLTMKLDKLDPDMFAAYLPERPRFDLTASWISGQVRYVLAHGEKKAHYLTANIQTGPAKLLAPASQKAVMAVHGVDMGGLRWDFAKDQGRVKHLLIQQPNLRLVRNQSGFNLTGLFSQGQKGAAETNSGQLGIALTISELESQGGTVEYNDRAVAPSVSGTFHNVQIHASNFSLNDQPSKVQANALLGKSPVAISGTLEPVPFQAHLTVTAKDLPLQPYHGYWKSLWPGASDWRGQLNGAVQLALVPDSAGNLSTRLSGDLRAQKLAVSLPGTRKAPLQAQQLDVEIAALRTDPQFYLDISRIDISGGDFAIERSPEGEFNIGSLWNSTENTSGESQASEASKGKSMASEPPFTIRKLRIKKTTLRFADATVKPAFQADLTDLSAEMGKFGAQKGRTPVHLDATIENRAELQVKGWVKPFKKPLQVNLDANILNYELSDLNPYATKYIRYEVERGRITTQVSYQYSGGDLAGRNQIAIRQLELGKRIGDNFEERVGIPLRLAIALLQDADGQIRLTVPVSGNLSDPKFNFGSLIWKAVRHAIIDFISAPLHLLGKVVTLGGRITRIHIDPVSFQPGSANLSSKGQQEIKQLAELLKKKPRLEIEINGFSSEKDQAPLKRRLLAEKLKSAGEHYQAEVARLYRLSKDIQGPQKLPPLKKMEDYLANQLRLPHHSLQELAEERMRQVEDALEKLGVDPGKLYPGKETVLTNESSGRVEFKLLT
ncbi:MAG TPA: DUF748 domain-containing protein [Terriglobales bacterium]|nr:DUF748 domain-containing protein [Terriglobales bacterium]